MADAELQARGKAIIEFHLEGIAAVKATLADLQSKTTSTVAAIGAANVRLSNAQEQVRLATQRLNAIQAANATAVQQVTQATNAQFKAETAVEKAIQAATIAQEKLTAATAAHGRGSIEYAKAQTIFEIKNRELKAADDALTQAVLNLTKANISNGMASREVALAEIVLSKSKIGVTNATKAVNKAIQENTTLLKQIDGYEKVAIEVAIKKIKLTKEEEAAIKAKKKALDDGVLVTKKASAASAEHHTKVTALSTAYLAAGSAVRTFVSAVKSIINVTTGLVTDLHKTVVEIKNFQNAVGGSTTAASSFSILAQQVGQSSKDIAISLGFLNQTLFKADATAAAAGGQIAKNLDNIGDSLAKLELDKLQRIGDLILNLEQSLAKIQADIVDAQNNLNAALAEAAADRDQKIRDAAETLAEGLANIQEDAVDSLADLQQDHDEKMSDYQEDKRQSELKYAEDTAQLEIDLQQKLASIDEEYNKKRLSLQDQYINASPLLRPFIQAQIDALEGQKQAEKDLVSAEFQLKLDRLKREHEAELAAIQLKIDREVAAYLASQEKIEKRAREQTAKLQAEYDKRVRDANRAYEDQVRAAQTSYDRQMDGFREQQQRLEEEYQQTWAIIFREFNQKMDEILDKSNEVAGGLGGNAATNSPLAKALEELGLDLAELDAVDGAHKLYMIAQALDSYEGNNKTGIINTLAGFFAPTMMNFIQVLGESSGTFEDFTNRLQQLYPNLIFTEQETDRIFNNFMKWNSAGLIIEDLKAKLERDLLPISEKLVESILNWWGDPANRAATYAFIESITSKINKVVESIGDVLSGKMTLGDFFTGLFNDGKGVVIDIGKFISSIIDTVKTSNELNASVNTFSVGLGANFSSGFVQGIAENNAILKAFRNMTAELVLEISKTFPGLSKLLGITDEQIELAKQQTLKATTTYEEFGRGIRAVQYTNETGQVVRTKLTMDQIIDLQKKGYDIIDYDTGKFYYSQETTQELANLGITENQQLTMDQFKAIISRTHGSVNKDTGEKLDTLTSKYSTSFGQISTTVNTTASGIITTFNNNAQSTTDAIVNPVLAADTTLGSRVNIEKFRTLGATLSGSITQSFGITIATWIAEGTPGGLAGLLQRIIEAIRDTFTMHSPSKVMGDLGINAALGFTQGYTDTMNSFIKAGIPDVTNKFLMRTDGVGRQTVNNYSATNQVPAINIYTTPNQSPEDIANVLMRELSRRMDTRLMGR